MLQISGEWSKKWNKYIFVRVLSLLENVNVDMVKTLVENDVLIVTLPKLETDKPDVKSIMIYLV